MSEKKTAVDAAVITALPKELFAVLTLLLGVKQVSHPGSHRVFYEAETPRGCRLVVACVTEMGATQAALLVQELLSFYQPARIMLTGIAGSLDDKVKLGDIVVSEQVVDYELGKIKDDKTEVRWNVYRNDPVFLQRAKEYQETDWIKSIKTPLPKGVRTGFKPEVHFGIVMSGNKVIASREAAKFLKQVWHKAVAVEMEGAGIGAALYRRTESTPFVMVKGICDKADAKKNDKWQEFAAVASAAFTLSLLESHFGPADMPPKETVAEKTLVPGTKMPLRAFRFLVRESFSMEELEQLAFDLGIDWEDIPGDTKSKKIIELYKYCKRKRKLQELIDLIDKETDGGITNYSPDAGP